MSEFPEHIRAFDRLLIRSLRHRSLTALSVEPKGLRRLRSRSATHRTRYAQPPLASGTGCRVSRPVQDVTNLVERPRRKDFHQSPLKTRCRYGYELLRTGLGSKALKQSVAGPM